QILQLLHGETAVLGQHSTGGLVEGLNDLRDGCCLLWPRHGSPSVLRRRLSVRTREMTNAPGTGPRARTPDLSGLALDHLRWPSASANPSIVLHGWSAITGGLWLLRRRLGERRGAAKSSYSAPSPPGGRGCPT